ncbi:hypothetical protein ACO2Q0_13705 [Phenylobacterium sp. VNQ135]|uniref:hypothetical protein n=1 Tax=Phenylobacterium sp. VNQ135 TaxID=3400922 RepID=UPI003C085FE0
MPTTDRPGLLDRLGAFGARRALAFAEWRARREIQAELRRPRAQSYRAFIQVNLIRGR